MEYIIERDRKYIMNKYHNESLVLAYNSNRFIRNEDIFDPATGMDPEQILEGIKAQDATLENLSRPVRKGKALECFKEHKNFLRPKRSFSCN